MGLLTVFVSHFVSQLTHGPACHDFSYWEFWLVIIVSYNFLTSYSYPFDQYLRSSNQVCVLSPLVSRDNSIILVRPRQGEVVVDDNAWGHFDFDKMIYTTAALNEYKIEIRDGIVHMKYDETLYLFTSGILVQRAYEEYMSKKIEEELLKEK